MGEEPGALRREVEEARAQLGETVDALAHKVSAPRRLVDRASAALRPRTRPEAIASRRRLRRRRAHHGWPLEAPGQVTSA